jgi:hypothetical protein
MYTSQKTNKATPSTHSSKHKQSFSMATDAAGNIENSDNTLEEDNIVLQNSTTLRCNKLTLTTIYSLLNLNIEDLSHIPKNGYKKGSVDIEQCNRAFYRASSVVQKICKAVSLLVCPDDNNFNDSINNKSTECQSEYKKLDENIQNLIIGGNRQTRLITQALLASSFPHQDCIIKLHKNLQQPTDTTLEKKIKFGRDMYKSSKKVFDFIVNGKDIPKHNHTFKVNANKVKLAIEFICNTLPLQTGICCDITICGHQFKNMPVYDCGGRSFEALDATYKSIVDNDECVRCDMFIDIVKLLTKRGESKCSLSTYYIYLCYCSSIFLKMMMQIKMHEFPDNYFEQVE